MVFWCVIFGSLICLYSGVFHCCWHDFKTVGLVNREIRPLWTYARDVKSKAPGTSLVFWMKWTILLLRGCFCAGHGLWFFARCRKLTRWRIIPYTSTSYFGMSGPKWKLGIPNSLTTVQRSFSNWIPTVPIASIRAGLFCCICCVPTCILCRGHFKAESDWNSGCRRTALENWKKTETYFFKNIEE